MEPVKQVVWDRMNAILQTDDKKPNYLVQAKRDEGDWVDIPSEFVSSIDIDNRLDFEASQCDIKLANEDGRFTPEKIGGDGAWETVFKDEFNWDTSAQYSKIENWHWAKENDGSYDSGGIKDTTGYNGYMTTGNQPQGTVSKIEFSVFIKNRGRFTFDYRKTTTNSPSVSKGDILWYDDFTKGLKPEYVFVHDSEADDWAIRDYSWQGGKPQMSSGYSYGVNQNSYLRLPIELPCRCILEYKHRIFYPRQKNEGDWASLNHRCWIDNDRPPVPPAPVGFSGTINAQNGGIEFGGDHSGHGSNYEHHQHYIDQGQHTIQWKTYFTSGRMLARWEMDYIKIFADETGGQSSGGTTFEVYIDDVLVKHMAVDIGNTTTWQRFWGELENYWFYIENPGRHTIRIQVNHNNRSLTDFVDIDNILVQNYVPGEDGLPANGIYGLLLVPNTEIKVWLGYGDAREDLILRFTGLIDRVIIGRSGTLEIKCRDMFKKLKDTMIKAKPGEYRICYPENPLDDKLWVVSDIIADLINKAGCIGIVQRTMVEENGAEIPYITPSALQFDEGKPYADAIKELTDGINFRCWADRKGWIRCMKYVFQGQNDPADFEITEYVDLTDLELVLDDADVRGKLRVYCSYNKKTEVYMDEFLHYVVCKGMDRYASVESEWMDTQPKRQKMAEFIFMQMKRRFRTKTIGTVGNPFADVWDFVNVLETVASVDAKKYTVVGMRTSVSDKGYTDIYDLQYGADEEYSIVIENDPLTNGDVPFPSDYKPSDNFYV